MTVDIAIIKRAAVALLDSLASEHPLKHQPSKASRYVLTAPDGAPLEVMLERGPTSRPNLWVHAKVAGSLKGTLSPAAKLWTETGKGGQPNYGRHSALEPMPQLGAADLVRLTPTNLSELGQILDQLLAASAAGGV